MIQSPRVGMYRQLRTKAAPLAKTLLFKSRAFDAIRQLYPRPQLAILRYHAICGAEGYGYASPGICISPSAFQHHIAYLSASCAVVSLPDAVHALREGQSLPANAVAITFDDGYADNLEAARALHRHGLTATFYLTAGCLAGGLPFWPSELRALLMAVRRPELLLSLGGELLRFPCGSAADRSDAVARLTKIFKSVSIPVREELREQLRAAAPAATVESPMLNWNQVREMQQHLGMTIGAHTLTHPNLPSAGVDAAGEIRGSKERLEAELGCAVTMFSYPNGGAECYYTSELQRIVRESGFLAATTSRGGLVDHASDPYGLARVQVSERVEDLAFTIEAERLMR